MGPDPVRQAVHERKLRAALKRFPPRHVRFPPRCMPVRGETVAEAERAQLAPWGGMAPHTGAGAGQNDARR